MWAWGLHTGNVNHMTKDCVLISSSLFSHKTMCNFFLQMYKKKPQTTWALHCLIGRKYQSNFPKGRTADVICFLNIQIYEIDNTILHCVLNIGTIFLITSSVFELEHI